MPIRLAHGWQAELSPGTPPGLPADFLRPAVRAIPRALARRLPPVRIRLVPTLDGAAVSEWTLTGSGLEIALATEGETPHDIAIELLTCAGQAFWDRAGESEIQEFLELLRREIVAGITGEIDEAALEEKRRLLSNRALAASPRGLLRYARAALAATIAEYVHALWHDVTVRTGPDYLPPAPLRARLELLARWFPPGRGYRLFPGTDSGDSIH